MAFTFLSGCENGVWPARSSKIKTPRAQRSTSKECPALDTISGAKYSGVPAIYHMHRHYRVVVLVVDLGSQTEICEFNVTLVSEQNVFRLEIAVDNL